MKKEILNGAQSYRKVKEGNFYCVDKSMMIYEFLKKSSDVTLITRPRRFGKTFNMSMMAEFFDITKDSSDIFKDTKIMETEYSQELNQWPVIFLSFADLKGDEGTIKRFLKRNLLSLYDRNAFVFESALPGQKAEYSQIYASLTDPASSIGDIETSLVLLCECMELYYGKKVMVFIDEYDTPFVEGKVHGFYNQIHNGLSALLRSTLKNCPSVKLALLTGIQRVAKENIFSGLNNLKVYTVVDEEYSEYFGFTEEETKEMLEYYDKDLNAQVKAMYDGYRFGNHEIYNPWSVSNYCAAENTNVIKPYWVNTSSNLMIRDGMKQCYDDCKDGFETLIEQGELTVPVTFDTSFF